MGTAGWTAGIAVFMGENRLRTSKARRRIVFFPIDGQYGAKVSQLLEIIRYGFCVEELRARACSASDVDLDVVGHMQIKEPHIATVGEGRAVDEAGIGG